MLDSEIDLGYVIGEIQNLQTEMETYFGPEGLVLPGLRNQLGEIAATTSEGLTALTDAVEGIEARLKEQGDLLTRVFTAVELWANTQGASPVIHRLYGT